MTLTKRATKGSALTFTEMDDNLTHLDLYKSVDRMQKHLDDMANNKVNIEFLKEQMEKAQESIEKLKAADREIV